MQYSIPLYDALLGANISPDKAKAVVDAFEKESDKMTSSLVTKDDLRQEIALLESRMTIKLGAMLVAAIGVFAALTKVL